MRERVQILADLVSLKGNLFELQRELSLYPWDSEEPLIQIRKTDLSNVIIRCIKSEITFEDLENWANTIECRDDLDFEVEEVKEFIFELANPILNGAITEERIKEILNELSE